MTGTQPITMTRHEVQTLSDFAATQGKARTYKIQRDTFNILWLVEPSGKLYRLSKDSSEAKS